MAGIIAAHFNEATARERLLSAAVGLFTQKGYSATTVREIVDAAGVTKPILYYYFGNKEGIYQHLIEEVHSAFLNLVDSFQSFTGNSIERLYKAAESFYTLAIQNLDIVRLIHVIFYGPPQGAPYIDIHSFHTRLYEAYLRIVMVGIAVGEIRPIPDFVTMSIMAVTSFAVDTHLAHPETAIGLDGLRKTLDVIFQGIAIPRTSPQEAS